jgi:hypothetical protein
MALYRNLNKDLKTTSPFLVAVVGKATIGASGAVTSQIGKGATVARTGTGVYTVTIDARGGVPDIVYASIRSMGATAYVAAIGAPNVATGVVTFTISAAATPGTAVDPATGTQIGYLILVQNQKYAG